MPQRVLVFQSAVGTGWTSPTNALAEDGSAAVYPPGGAQSWLRLTDAASRVLPEDDEVLGVEVVVVALGTGGPGRTVVLGKGLKEYAAALGDLVDDAPETYDGVAGTYYGWATQSLSEWRGVTVVHDLGLATGVGRIVTIGTNYAGSSRREWHYSDDGTTWTPVSYAPDTPPGYLPGDPWTYDQELADCTVARYWRYSSRDELDEPPAFGDSSGPRVNEFRLYGCDGTTLLTPGWDGGAGQLERLDVSLTLDGSTPVGETKTFTVGPSGGTYTLGGVLDLWGLPLEPDDIALSTFGAMVRRGGPSGEALHTERRVDVVRAVVTHQSVMGSLEMPREYPLQRCVLGKEVTPGTPVSPTILLKAARLTMQSQEASEEVRFQGELIPGMQVNNGGDMATGQVTGKPTYDELGLLLRSLFGDPVTTTVTTGVYRHEFNFDPRGQSPFRTYTNEWGDKTNAERYAYVLLTALGMSVKRNESPSIDGQAIGRRMVLTTLTPGSNAVQTVTVTGSPTGGNFKLRFKGATTANIAYNANAAAYQAALEALSTIGSGNVTVTGSGPFTVTFGAALAGEAQPALELAANNLTGGSSPDVTIAITTLGGYTEFACVPIEPGQANVYFATSLAGLAAGKLAACFSSEWSCSGKHAPVFVLDDTLDSFAHATEDDVTLRGAVLIEANSVATTMVNAKRDNTLNYLRLLYTSKVNIPGTSTKFSLDVTLAGQVNELGAIENDQQIVARRFGFSNRFDPAWGKSCQFVLVNGVASY
ncbi:MAG: hypothetical protein KIT11_05405 [Fimbriimonadaceae bacterium]|nr:hypothetical protein [Fimbriimonadaceae bacterium]QYK56671.1 MAG: hypothetical protein KF733_04115 [Fimbriimonadaceae bacterium]